MILSLLAAGVLGTYLVRMIRKNKGIPESISATSYIVKDKSIFTTVMASIAMLMLPEMIDASSTNTQFLAFLSSLGVAGVGATPWYKGDDRILHFFFAYMACISSQVMIALNNPIVLLGWVPVLVYLLITRDRNWGFWAEIQCLLNTIVFSILPKLGA